MRNIKNWSNFLFEADPNKITANQKWTNSRIWWGVPQGNDDTGGFEFCLTPISEKEPAKGAPADIHAIDFDDVNGDCMDFNEGTEEYYECMEEQQDIWERGCTSEVFKRIFFYMSISTIPAISHQKGGYIYNKWESPLPQTITQFINEMESRTKHYVFLAAVRTDRMRNFILEHFFPKELYKNEDAPGIVKNLDRIMGGEELSGITLLIDQLKEISDRGDLLEYSKIIDLFKNAHPKIEWLMTAKGIDFERLEKLERANKLLKRK